MAAATLSFWQQKNFCALRPLSISQQTAPNPRLSSVGILFASGNSMMKIIRDKSVLIIDDDTGMLRALDKVLSGAGAVVTRAQNAGDAVEILTARKEKFDLVITDLRMPFVTGLTVVYAIHQIYPALPVIVLTAFGSADVKAECFRQGAAAFLEKPLDTSELLAAVEKVFASQMAGSGSDGPDRNEKNNLMDESIEAEKDRLNAMHLMSGRQNCDPRTGAGAAEKRTQQVYGYRPQY